MKSIKKVLIPTLGAIAAFSLASCGPSNANDGVTKNADGTFTVRVGNTNGISAAPTVFAPMGYGMEAYAWYYGENVNDGKVKIDYKHLDDGYLADTRAVHTDTLLNAEKCFGIVYSFEDQAAKLDETNKVEVYTPLTKTYYQESGESVASFPIQPIDFVEGEHLMATAFAPTSKGGLGGTKVGVIAGNGQTGNDQVEAMEAIAAKLGKVKNTDYFIQRLDNVQTADPTTAVAALKTAGCDVVIVTDATYLLLTSIAAMATGGWSNVTMLASYKLSNATYLSNGWTIGSTIPGFRLLTTGWIAAGIQNANTYADWAEYVKVLTLYAQHKGEALATVDTETAKGSDGAPEVIRDLQTNYTWAANGVSPYFYDSYAMAGYEGMYVFCDGISRLYQSNKLDGASTADYVAVMEEGGMNIPMSTVKVDLSNGRRTGAQALTLVEATAANHTLGEPARGFRTTADLL